MKQLVDLVDFSIIDNSFDPRYEGSKFENYKKLGAKQKGAVSERMLSTVLEGLGHKVESSLNSDHDRLVDGVKVEMKTATLVKNTEEKLSFLQIRPNQDLDKYLMTVILPNDIESYWIEKSKILELIETGRVYPQHGGKNGNSGTYCWYPSLTELRSVGKKVSELVGS